MSLRNPIKLFLSTLLLQYVMYDQPNNESFTQKIEEIQNNATLAITGLIKGTSKHQTSILVDQLF